MKHIKPINEFFKDFIKKALTPKPIDYDFKGTVDINLYSKGMNDNIGSLDPNTKVGSLGHFYNSGFDYCTCYFGRGIISNSFNKFKNLKKSDLEYKLNSVIQIAEDNNCVIRYYRRNPDSVWDNACAAILIKADAGCIKDIISYLDNS